MTVTMKCLFAVILGMLLFVPLAGAGAGESLLLAQADGQEGEAAEKKSKDLADEGWISNGKSLGRWWLKNAKTYDPMPLPLLYHLEGKYAYAEKSGNIDVENHEATALISLRKGIFTSFTTYSKGKSDVTINLTKDQTSTETGDFMQDFSLALTDRISVQAGMMWNTNSAIYLDDRYTYYGGLQVVLFDSPNLGLSLGGYYGQENNSYMNDKVHDDLFGPLCEITPPGFCDPAEDFDSDGIRVIQRFNATIISTPFVTVWETFDYMSHFDGSDEFEDSDYYHWELDLGVSVALSETTSLYVSYNIYYDKNYFFDYINKRIKTINEYEAIMNELKAKDTTLAVGINFSF
ncbi:hypothetical protein QUF80_11585 [Desulfococcaceae bacterium HSG8]|nr:hypothetical protein [Desulfococcaceae bacterium HSG8]